MPNKKMVIYDKINKDFKEAKEINFAQYLVEFKDKKGVNVIGDIIFLGEGNTLKDLGYFVDISHSYSFKNKLLYKKEKGKIEIIIDKENKFYYIKSKEINIIISKEFNEAIHNEMKLLGVW